MRLLLSGDETNQEIHGRVFSAMRYLLRQRLEVGGQATIIDATNIRRKDRKPWIQLAQRYGARVEAVFLNPPLGRILERNRQRARVVPEEVIRTMEARLQVPERAEGFLRVRTIDE